MSYPTLLRQQEHMSKSAVEKVRSVGADPNAIVTYDNFDFAEGRRGERTGDTQEFRSITTALTFPGQFLPPNGLTPDMWRLYIPLSPVNVIDQLRPEIWTQVSSINSPIYTILIRSIIGSPTSYGRRDLSTPRVPSTKSRG